MDYKQIDLGVSWRILLPGKLQVWPKEALDPEACSRLPLHTRRWRLWKLCSPHQGIILKCYFSWTRLNLPKGKVKGHRACQPRAVPPHGLTKQLTHWQRRKSSQFLPSGSWSLPWATHLCVFSSSLFWTGLFSAVFLFLCGHCILAMKEFCVVFFEGGGGGGHHRLSCHTTRTYTWPRLLITQVFELNQSIWDLRLVSLGEA